MKSLDSHSYEVSIVIVNYNTLQMTEECIQSVVDKTQDLNYEIIVVDNCSIDGSKEYFEKVSNIKYIYSTKNLGFGQASNLGVANSSGKNILLLNSDTILINNAIKILSDYLNENIDVGIVGGNLYKQDLRPTLSFEKFFPGIMYTMNLFTKNLINKILHGKNLTFNHSENAMEVAYVSGADLMISACHYNEIKGFSKEFFMYYEETDLCYRIFKRHLKIVCVPEAKIIHLEGGSQKRSNDRVLKKKQMMQHSRELFIKRNHSHLYYMIDKVLYRLYSSLVKIIKA